MISQRAKHTFISLRAQGFSYDKISKEIKVSKPTLLKWNAEMSEELTEAKVMEVDAILQEFEMTRVGRIRRNALMLKKVEDELAKREFDKYSTDELLEYKARFIREINAEAASEVREYRIDGPLHNNFDSLFESKVVKRTALD